MTIKELLNKWDFEEVEKGIYKLSIDDDETVELYHYSPKFAFVRHECDGDVEYLRTYATEIDKYITELYEGCID